MAQKLVQTEQQQLLQQQRLSQQQMLQIRLLEMPLAELEQAVALEIDDNPALERGEQEDDLLGGEESVADFEVDDTAENKEQEEREDALDAALQNLGADDEMPTSYSGMEKNNAEYEERVFGDTTSFYDKLNEQVAEIEIEKRQREILMYLIGSLDDDGLLRKDISDISDELAIYQGIDASDNEIKEVLHTLQGFEPAGVGARNLQECLLLQVDNKKKNNTNEQWTDIYDKMSKILKTYFDDFINRKFTKIGDKMGFSENELNLIITELCRLNPKPGASMGETLGRSVQQITPDFIVETNEQNELRVYLTRGNIPELRVSKEFTELIDTYKQSRQSMNRRDKEALLYAKEKVERARGYIEAIRQRQITLLKVMKAIVDWQSTFFLDGDELDLQPMILKNIAEATELDISTVSRVSNVKYVQTRWGTFPLKYFFSEGYSTNDGETLSTRRIKAALSEIINNEDKHSPLSDDDIKDRLKDLGFPIARRTVAKYREQLGIPVARLRREG